MPPLEDSFHAKPIEAEQPPERADFNRDAAKPNEAQSARETQVRNFGDLIPNQRETSEASDSAGDRLRESAGLEKVPEAGAVQYSIKVAEMAANRAEGVSRAQNIAFVGANGESVVGAQFTKQDGTYLKTNSGDTYRVEANNTGGFDLNPVKGDGQQFSAVQMKVLTDAFVLRAEKYAVAAPRQDDGQRAVLDALNGGVKRGEPAAIDPTEHRAEPPNVRDAALPGAERATSPGAHGIPAEHGIAAAPHAGSGEHGIAAGVHAMSAERAADAQMHGRTEASSRDNQNVRTEQSDREQPGVARGGNDLLSQIVNLIVEKLSPSPDQIIDGKHQSMREISASIVEMYQTRPELVGVLNVRSLVSRQIDGASPLSMMNSGAMPEGTEKAVAKNFEARVSNVIAAVLNNIRTQKENVIAAAAQSQAEAKLDSASPEQTAGMVRTPQFHVGDSPTQSPAGATIVQGRIDIGAQKPNAQEAHAEPQQQEQLPPPGEAIQVAKAEAPRVESPEELAEKARLVALALEQEQIAAEKLALEQQENEEAERLAREEAERQEKEAIKQRIQKREEERRRRYLVKDKDTFESIAVKQLRDVRLHSLVYDINKHLLPVKTVRGKQVRELRPRMIIFLPTAKEIEKFRNGPGQPSVDAMQVQELLEADAITGGGDIGTVSDIFGADEPPKFEGLTPEQRAHVEQMLGPLPVSEVAPTVGQIEIPPPQEVYVPPQEAHSPPQEPHLPPQEAHSLPQEAHSLSQEAHSLSQEAHSPPREAYMPPQEVYVPPQEAHSPPQEVYVPPQEVYLPPPVPPQMPPKVEAVLPPSPALSADKAEPVLEEFNRTAPIEQTAASFLFREIERTTYTVRLGDSLKSISMRHPALEDVALWSLLAEVNALSTATDARGNPDTKLVRGMRLLIPTAEEVAAHKQRRSQLGNSVPSPRITGV